MSAGWKYPWLPPEDVVSTPCGGVRGLHTHSQHTRRTKCHSFFSARTPLPAGHTTTESWEYLQWAKQLPFFPFFFFMSCVIVNVAFSIHLSASREIAVEQHIFISTEEIHSFHRCDSHLAWTRCFLRETISALFPACTRQTGKLWRESAQKQRH